MPAHPEIIKAIFARIAVSLLIFILGAVTLVSSAPAALAADGPDLIVQDITLSPQNPTLNDTVTITVNVKNQGNMTAGFSHLVCYADSNILATLPIDSLNAGTMTTKTFTWEAQAGKHTIKAVADSGGFVLETDETNNTETFTFSTLAPDLVIQSVSWSPDTPSKGENVIFSVTVKNQGNSRSSYTNVNVYIDGSSRGLQDIAAIDPGDTVTKTYSWNALSGQHLVQIAVDEVNNVSESDESNNKHSFTFSTSPPDLVIENITWEPESPSKYDEVTFNVFVGNQGTGRADSCLLTYWVDDGDQYSLPIGQIDAGDSTNMTFSMIAVTSVHTIKAIIDYQNNVAESDENNNESTVNLLTMYPDLTVTDVTWSPTNAGAGDTVTFTIKIKNQGSGRAGASRTAYYISGGSQGYLNTAALEADAEATLTVDWEASTGSHTVSIVPDCDNMLVETSEDNNKLTKTISIIPPDLIISNIIWSPINPATGDSVAFKVFVENQGGGVARGFYIAYYLDDNLLGSDFIPVIASGGSVNTTYTWESQKGRHTFKAIADHNERVTENNENNNEDFVIVTPNMPDLAINTVTWSPADIPTGHEITFNINIENQGSLSAGPSRITYYIDDNFIGYADIGQINAGDVVTEHLVWTAAAGLHTIAIVADSTNQVDEIDEANNSKVITLPPPDLLVQDVTWSPSDVSIGDTVTFSATFVNRGSSKTQVAQASYYVDGLSAGSLDIPEIEPAASITGSFEWVAEAGTHSIGITADTNNRVTESDETNNDKEITFSTMTPDLTVEDVSWLMEFPLTSDDAAFAIIIKNQGSDTSGSSQLTYSIDESPALHKDIKPIPAGDSVTITLVSILESGPHTIDVTIDPDDEIIELEESNNQKTLSFSTSIPDLAIKSIAWTPLTALPGDTITITAKVENRGRSEAINPRLTLHIDGSPLDYADIAEIESGVTVTADFSWTVEAGPHEISVFADLDKLIPESNETNNTMSRTLTLEEPPAPVKQTPKPVVSSPTNKGFLEGSWWLILLVAALCGGMAFMAVLKSLRKN